MLHLVFLGLLLGTCVSTGSQKIIPERKIVPHEKVVPEEKIVPEEKTERKPKSLSRGWGDYIDWVESYEKGVELMMESQKPLMVIFHRENCPHSIALKEKFSTYEPIQILAKEDFIMVNLVDETTDPNLSTDGYYVPRILFVDPSKAVRIDITGKYHNRRFTYEPVDMVHLLVNMKTAKKLLHSEL